MTVHTDPHTNSGDTLTVEPHTAKGWTLKFRVTDWADRVYGESWQEHDAPECLEYGLRGLGAAMSAPEEDQWDVDDEVLYGYVEAVYFEGERQEGPEYDSLLLAPALMHVSEVV